MIYDCFTFCSELDLLEIRLNYLNPVVDKFVICEATKTHSGKDKPLYFHENQDRFKQFHDKIIHVIADDLPIHRDRWKAENHQRNAILSGLQDIKDEDGIMISDVDEIPKKYYVKKGFTGAFSMHSYMFYLNASTNNLDWRGTVALTYKAFKERCGGIPQTLRNMRTSMEPIRNGGWHFAWLGGPEAIRTKLSSFGHSELDLPKYHDKVEECYEKVTPLWSNGPMEIMPIDKTYPKYLYDNLSKYSHLVYNKCIGNPAILHQLEEIVKGDIPLGDR